MTTPYFLKDLMQDEGCRLHAYEDTVGVWTIGYGHAHVPPGTTWSQEQCDGQLVADVSHVKQSLDVHLSWWRNLDDVRQDVIANMAFNLGVSGLLTFKTTLAHIRIGEWAKASSGLLSSKWATQVHGRAKRLAEQMLTGQRTTPGEVI